MNKGDTARGAKLFKKHCMQCHTVDAQAKVGVNIGPPLFNICGRCSGIYQHKGAGGKSTIESVIIWTDSQLLDYMLNPRSLSGNGSLTMNFPGIPKAQDRMDILHYLHTLKYPTPTDPPPTAQPYGKISIYRNI
jgi:cytochrome c